MSAIVEKDHQDIHEDLIASLVRKSSKQSSSIIQQFDWPDYIELSSQWIPDELLTVYGTQHYEKLSSDQLDKLRKWESINFYSQNVHGERTLCQDLMSRIYESRFLKESDYIYHFIKEENDHMAVFAEFCKRYGEILPNNRIDLGRRQDLLIEELLLFCRTVLFEYYVDSYNRIAGSAQNVVPIAKEINNYHHVDEARHILFSREMIKRCLDAVRKEYGDERVKEVARYVEDYMINQIELVYSSRVYEIAEIEKPSEFRISLLQDPGRRQRHLDWIELPFKFFNSIGLFTERTKEEIIDDYFKPKGESLQISKSDNPKAAIAAWLKEQSGGKTEIDDNTDILDSGLVDSLVFMRFLVVIEQASGKEMRLEEIDLDDIRTLSNIEKAFLN